MNIIQELAQNKFLLVLLSEEQYLKQLYDIIKSVDKTKHKICYVCLSKPYKDVLDDLKKKGIDTKFFFFIDTLSSHYGKPTPKKNCIFVDSPMNLKSIKEAIAEAIEKENCSVLLFDTISTLFIYQGGFSVLRFTHSLMVEERKEDVRKIFIVLKRDTVLEEENKKLIKDLTMFADKTLDLG